jgi:hypothetical protein
MRSDLGAPRLDRNRATHSDMALDHETNPPWQKSTELCLPTWRCCLCPQVGVEVWDFMVVT